MEYLIVIILGIAVIWLIFHYSAKAEQKKKEVAEKVEPSNLKVNIPGVETPKVETPKPGLRAQKSLDALYASSHGMWVCRCCETLNDSGAPYCSACGAKKS